jgi:hypothetical protein
VRAANGADSTLDGCSHARGGERNGQVQAALGVGDQKGNRWSGPADDAAQSAVVQACNARARVAASPKRNALIIASEGVGSGTGTSERSRSHSAYTLGVESPTSLRANTHV